MFTKKIVTIYNLTYDVKECSFSWTVIILSISVSDYFSKWLGINDISLKKIHTSLTVSVIHLLITTKTLFLIIWILKSFVPSCLLLVFLLWYSSLCWIRAHYLLRLISLFYQFHGIFTLIGYFLSYRILKMYYFFLK